MDKWELERERIIGLGNQSIRKSYYPLLKARLKELERFRQILDHSLDGILLISSGDGTVLDLNNAAAKLFDQALCDIRGRPIRQFLPRETYPKVIDFIEASVEDNLKDCRIEFRVKDEIVHYEINLNREQLDPEIIIVGIIRNISRRVKNEINLKQAKEDAERASRVKSEFLAVMSHEMRTPLNPILGFATLLKEQLHDPVEIEYVDYIIQAANRQLELINDVLNYTAMDRGTMTAHWSQFNLFDICRCAIEDNRHKANHLELLLKFGTLQNPIPEPLEVTGEQSMLLRILDNLIGNACKYTKSGHVILQIEEQRLDNVSSEFCFSVIDTGIGIPEDIRLTIFDAFTQADSSHKRNYEGIGLGLAICKKLVEFLHGRIVCDSEVGKGSTFSVWLPMQRVPEPTPISVTSRDNSPETHRKIRILIAEDRLDNAKLMEALFKKSGSVVDIAKNGVVAANLCLDYKYDCILMDLSMPEMSGFESAHQIRKAGLNTTTPIIAITANVTDGTEDKCKAADFDYYFPKPVDMQKLKAVVAEITSTSDQTYR